MSNNYLAESLRSIIPINYAGAAATARMVRTNHLSEQSYYVNTSGMYGDTVSRQHYGAGDRLSTAYVHIHGMRRRTKAYFHGSSFETGTITSIYPRLNKVLFKASFIHLKRKFDAHTY